MDTWQAMRMQFPVCRRWTYLNHAAVSPLPLTCSQRVQAYLHELGHHGAAHYPQVVAEQLAAFRRLGAQLLGARPDQVFAARSTTEGLGVVATGLPLRPGDNVVLVEREFPANLRPWMPLKRKGVELRLVPQRDGRVLLDDLQRAMDGRTRLLSLSFVQFFSGFRSDLGAVAELCRRHDALFVVDAIQGVGAFPIDVSAQGVDFLSADAHKWLVGPEGAGLGFAADRALERIQPALEGWLAVERPFDFFDLDQPLKADAARYETSAYNTAGLLGLTGSLELLLSAGIANIADRILELTDQLTAGLSAKGWQVLSPRQHDAEKSGIVTARKDGVDPAELQGRLFDAGFVLAVRDGALRVSPHAYNLPEEIDALLSLL